VEKRSGEEREQQVSGTAAGGKGGGSTRYSLM